jgi:ABC-type nitrate/sulfonate/bicarbonate transport system substrate-binding protein
MPARTIASLVLVGLILAGACAGPTSDPPARAPVAAAGAATGPSAPASSAAAASGAPSPADVPSRPKEPLSFAIPQRGLNYIVPTIAAALGYFDEAGLDVKMEVMVSNLTVAAMQRGDVQITGSGGSAIRAAVQGAPFKLVSFMTVRPTYYLMTVPELRSPSQLQGARIGVNNIGGTLHFFSEMYLRELGMNPSDVTFLALGPNQAQHIAAMHAGALDGSVLDPGTTAIAERQGFHLLKSLGEVAPNPQQGMVVIEEYSQKYPEQVRGFLKALVRAMRYVKQNPRETAATGRQEIGMDMDEATSLRALQLYTEALSSEAPGYANAKELEAFYEYDIRIPLEIPAGQPVPVLHDFGPLLAAYDELGLPRPQ